MKTFIFNIILSIFVFNYAYAEQAALISTTAMIEDIVKNIKPQSVASKSLIGSGVDPHLFKPTRTDMITLLSAKIVFLNGNHLEGKMIDSIEKLSVNGKKIIPVTERIPKGLLIESAEYEGNFDPHVWMDPISWIQVADVVRQALRAEYPEYEKDIESKYKSYESELHTLDAYIQKSLDSVPRSSRVLITAHDAFAYFGKRYNLEVLGIQGISTESEASVYDIEKLISLIVERKVQAVFLESTVSEKNIKALLEGAQMKGHALTIGGQLFSDAMGREGTYRGTYIGMIDHNVTTIVNALGGNAPVKGMKGEL